MGMAAEQHRLRPGATAARWVFTRVLAYVVVVVVALCIGPGGATTDSSSLRLEFGRSINPHVQARITNLLRPFLLTPMPSQGQSTAVSVQKVVLSFGNTPTTRALIPEAELAALGSEGFIVRSNLDRNGTLIVATDGNSMIYPTINITTNIGAHFGAYEMLQRIGFAFLHPLQPLVPDQLDFSFVGNGSFSLREVPYFAIRGVHYHTEHPLELMEFLNGFDIVYPASSSSSSSTSSSRNWSKHTDKRPHMSKGATSGLPGESWDSMIPEFERAMEWTVANKQNRWEWILLYAQYWDEFAWSNLRKTRLNQIIEIAHSWGVVVGADCGIAITQQHGWPLIQNVSNPEDEAQQIKRHLDWLLLPYNKASIASGGCGFDFLSTESGFSEMTHPDCGQMLLWMNMTTAYTSKLGKEAFIKCHCSTGQVCKDYKDPLTGQPINFNLLPYYADSQLGIYPHTVQFYNWTEPAPTYGNVNFTYMLDFLKLEAGKRKTVYHGETAYWVNYDIDVPLFLPVYGNGRLYDIRAIARTQALGQINFNSGWEWGYWLSDVITARASWNPRMDEKDHTEAMRSILHDIFAAFGSKQEAMVQLLLDTIELERDVLIYGKVNGKIPSTVVKRNGQAYIEGWDTWSELGTLVSPSTSTQPNKVGIVDVSKRHERDAVPHQVVKVIIPNHVIKSIDRSWLGTEPEYWSEIEPLLSFMESSFSTIADRFRSLQSSVPKNALPFWLELCDSANITALRAKQVHRLYNYAASYWKKPKDYRQSQLSEAESALAAAAQVVAARESNYRVPVERIAGWRDNPTVYTFGYLWTVHSLFYWWRDYGKSLDNMTWEAYFSPCYLNTIDPINTAFGEGITLNVTHALYNVFERFGWLRFIGDCLAAPPKEPKYPADLFA